MTSGMVGAVFALVTLSGLGFVALRSYKGRPSHFSTASLAACVAGIGAATAFLIAAVVLRYFPRLVGIERPRWRSSPQVELHFSMSTAEVLILVVLLTGLIFAIALTWHRMRTRQAFIPVSPIGSISVLVATVMTSGGATLLTLRSAPRQLTEPPGVGWAKASGEVPNLVLPTGTVQEIIAASERNGEENLAQTVQIASSRQDLSIYNALISPVIPSTKNVLLDEQDTQIDFFVGEPSPENAVPQPNAQVGPKITGAKEGQNLDVTLLCSFCQGSRLQRGTIAIESSPVLRSTHATFKIKPDKSLTADDTGHLIFQVTGKAGILYDSVVVPVAMQSPGVSNRTDGAATSTLSAIGNYVPPPGARPVDLTLYCSSDGQAIDLQLEPNNQQLKTLFGGRERDSTSNKGRVFPAKFTSTDLSGRLREDHVHLGAIINQDPALERALTGDPTGATVIPQITTLSADQGRSLMDQIGETGKYLYDNLFGGPKELQDVIGILENFKRSDGKPVLIRIVTQSISLPWQFLHPLGPANEDGFWGFKYELVVDPAPDKKGYYPGNLHYGNGPLIFGKYHAGVGDPNQLVDSKGQTEYGNLSSTLGFKGLLPVADSKKLFLDELNSHRSDLQMLVVFTHARNDIAEQPGTNDVVLGQSGGGPALAFGPAEFVSVNALENLRTSVAPPAVFEFAQHPLVLLNGCTTGSASFFALGNRTFPKTFLSFGARGVVATEAPVWALFADDFGTSLLRNMKTKIPVSLALMKSRKDYVRDSKNPLGLLYTYYGGVDSSLVLE
jgi:hypothetical protein